VIKVILQPNKQPISIAGFTLPFTFQSHVYRAVRVAHSLVRALLREFRRKRMYATPLNPLIRLRRAIIIRLDSAAVQNHPAADGGKVGLCPQRPADHRIDLGLDADGPAGTVGLAARRRDANVARMRGGGEHRIQLVAEHLLDVGLRIELPRLGRLAQHDVGKFCAAVGRAASGQRHRCARHRQC
jgi:hypothetical protein